MKRQLENKMTNRIVLIVGAALLLVLLSGCNTFAVERKWPRAPELGTCPQLYTVPNDNTKLSVILETVTNNYSLYNECRERVNAWQEWYSIQKQIFESVD